MGTIPTRPALVRRRLVGASVIATMLGLLRSARTAHATNGDPVILGDPNEATTTTELIGKIVDDALLRIQAGKVNGQAKVSPTAIVAQGHGQAGYGVYTRGGDAGSASSGGVGIRTTGGRANPTDGGPPSYGGPGLVATGGKSGTGTGGDGALVFGGNAARRAGDGTAAYGAVIGARGSGSLVYSYLGTGACAVVATAVKGAGPGVVAMGGTPGITAEDPGGQGLIALGGVRGETSSRSRAGVCARHDARGPGLEARSQVSSPDGVGLHGLSNGGYGGLFISDGGLAVSATGDVEGVSVTDHGIVASSKVSTSLSATSMTGVAIAGSSVNGPGGHMVAAKGDLFGAHIKNAAATANTLGPTGLLVTGDWVVQNGIKSAAVPTSKGLTLLYAVEGPVAMFEDVGTVRLTAGRGRVDLDPIFAETIDASEYFVFASARGDAAGVYVASQDSRGFELREQGGGASTFDVSYRVVARRKGLAERHRLATFSPPQQAPRPEARPRRLLTREPLPPAIRPKRPPTSDLLRISEPEGGLTR